MASAQILSTEVEKGSKGPAGVAVGDGGEGEVEGDDADSIRRCYGRETDAK